MKKYVFESLKFFCAAILCTILSAFATPARAALPDGYTELEYIESTGTQYIDTRYTMTNTSGIKIVIDDTATNSPYASTAAYFVGSALQSSYMGYFTRVSSNMVASVWAWNGENVLGNNITSTHSTVYINYMNDRKFIYNNGTRDYVREGNLPTLNNATSSLYLFATSAGLNYKGVGKMYSAQITENQSIVRNLVPARRNSDNVLGMYDTVGNRFYTNAGDGEFVAGPEACEGERVAYTSATGTGTQSGTPTPDNPIEPVFYQQGNMVLRKVGDYADSYDATTGKITRNVGVLTLRKNLSWYTNGRTGYFYLDMPTAPYQDSLRTYNTHFPVTLVNSTAATGNVKMAMFTSGNGTELILIHWDEKTTLAAWQNWLEDQYAAGTPVIIYYPLATPVEEDWDGGATYCETPIKIATTKYNESAFGPLNTALANAISVVDTVVSNTITQAGRIATLQAQKQTRPANDTCPAYKQCLLVEDEQGVPHWYEITDPFRDFVAPIIANNVAPASTTNQPGYTQLQYIESTGEQYIDTGIVLKGTDVVEVKYSNVNRTGTSCLLFGYYKANGNNRFAYNFWRDSIMGGYLYYGAEQEQISTPPTNDGLAHIIKMGNGSLYHDSTLIKSGMSSNFTASENMFLFASSGTSLFQTKARVHYAKIYNDGTLVRNFIPAKRNSDGAIGMYDTVNDRFYTNAGTGTFTAGPVVEQARPTPARLR